MDVFFLKVYVKAFIFKEQKATVRFSICFTEMNKWRFEESESFFVFVGNSDIC